MSQRWTAQRIFVANPNKRLLTPTVHQFRRIGVRTVLPVTSLKEAKELASSGTFAFGILSEEFGETPLMRFAKSGFQKTRKRLSGEPLLLGLVMFRADDICPDWAERAGFNPILPFPIGDKDLFRRLASAFKGRPPPARQPVDYVYV